ncbi:MAG: sigma-70 family RNA polymerase sigma factor [Candidatus Rokuibacteriota bacterium]
MVDLHLDSLYRFALRLTHNRAEAEDVVQDACVRAFRSFHRFNPGTNSRAWLFTILRNLFLNRVRREGREVLAEDVASWESTTVGIGGSGPQNPEEEFFQTVLHGDVDRALKALPLPFREVVFLTDLEGFTYREAAEVLSCPVGTVMSRLSRARCLLRQALARYARDHGYLRGAE